MRHSKGSCESFDNRPFIHKLTRNEINDAISIIKDDHQYFSTNVTTAYGSNRNLNDNTVKNISYYRTTSSSND